VRAAFWMAAALAVLVLAGVVSASSAPKLRIVVELPLAVGGSSFHARELVRVTATGRFGERSRSVRATSTGRFMVRFVGLSGDPCTLRKVTAIGGRGSRAMLRLPPGVCPELGPG
jgi:uncharacterized protein (DUF58 family)